MVHREVELVLEWTGLLGTHGIFDTWTTAQWPTRVTDNFVVELFASDQLDVVHQLVIWGYYDHLPDVEEKLGGHDAMSRSAVDLLQVLPSVQVSQSFATITSVTMYQIIDASQ